MSDELTPAEVRALGARIMGQTDRPTLTDVIEAAAAHAPEADDVRGLPPSGDDAEAEELTSGCPDNGEPHNPWEPQR